MTLEKLFPEQFRVFGRGELSLCVERFGGIDSLSILDVREVNGRLYPDRFPIPWVSKDGETLDRPLYSPGIQFRHDGRLYYPAEPEIYPFGFDSSDFSLAAGKLSVSLIFRPYEGEEFCMMLSKHHLPEGVMKTFKNQFARKESNIEILPAEVLGSDFNPSYPFFEDEMFLSRRKPVFRGNIIVFCAECRFIGCVRLKYWAIRFSGQVEMCEKQDVILFSCAESGDAVEIGFGFGESEEEAVANASIPFRKQRLEAMELCASAAKVDIDGMPEAGEFIKIMPGYQRHLLVTETMTEISIRAAMNKYGFYALWDHVYPVRDFLLFNEFDKSRKMLRYMINYPWVHTFPWVSMQLVMQTNEYIAYSGDTSFLREVYPHFKKYLDFNQRLVDADTGFIALTGSCCADVSAELGMDGLYYACCMNSWWYNALRCLENMSFAMNDNETSMKCAALITKLEAHYENAFFDRESGYLRAAVKLDGSLPSSAVFHNAATIGMDYVHGMYLMRNIIKELADYQALKLYHPMGHTAVSYDSDIPCEMWKAVHMNQHLGHECRTARLGGRPEEARRVVQGYLEYFSKYRCAVETFNLAGCPGDCWQLADWQAFSATGAAQAIVTGVAGWFRHIGGWTWMQGGGPEARLHIAGVALHTMGDGAYGDGLTVGEEKIQGTLQLPADAPEGEICVQRIAEAPLHPVLLMAIDASVRNVSVESGVLSFTVENRVHAPVMIYSPERPMVSINGVEHSFEWNEENNTLWFDAIFLQGDCVNVVAP